MPLISRGLRNLARRFVRFRKSVRQKLVSMKDREETHSVCVLSLPLHFWIAEDMDLIDTPRIIFYSLDQT